MTEEFNSSPDNEGENYDDPLTDPLTDPLALDIEVELDPIQETDNVHNNEDTKSAIEGSSDHTTIEEIIFVDIEKLKGSNNRLVEDEEEENNEDYDEDEVDQSNSTEASNYVEESDINGNEKHHHHHQLHDNNVDCESHETELDVEEPSSSVVDGITSSPQYESNQKSDKESEKTSTTLDKSADNSSVISVISSEPENDETDISELRSDGSDSGLGSEILHSVSAIEKNLKLLTPAKSSLKRRSNETESHEEPKKPRHSINFSDITVYYFPRCQGFSCVPTQGGSSLGMTSKHAYKRWVWNW